MKYKALSSEWKYFEPIESEDEDNSMRQDMIVHTWTKGKEYEISITDDFENAKFSISFESDAGTVNDLHILLCNQHLFENVFGLDLSECVNHAIKWQLESQIL